MLSLYTGLGKSRFTFYREDKSRFMWNRLFLYYYLLIIIFYTNNWKPTFSPPCLYICVYVYQCIYEMNIYIHTYTHIYV